MAPNTKTVLLVEDDPFLRELSYSGLKKALSGSHVDILVAENGTQALARIDEQKTVLTLILLDILLPDKNGYEILEYLHSHPDLSKIPVVVLSNLAQEKEIDRAMSLGARGYLVKAQVDIDDIVTEVKKYL